MKITKFGHSCLLLEVGKARILLDPGTLSAGQNTLRELDAILITHEHSDHLDKDMIKNLILQNPSAKVITNKGVGKVLDGLGVAYELLEHGGKLDVRGVPLEGFGEWHAVIYHTLPRVVNTGYWIGERLFYPGDALNAPPRRVEVLALPVVAPWTKVLEVVEYAIEVRPKLCFPVHDGIMKAPQFIHQLCESLLAPYDIPFRSLGENEVLEI